MTERSNSSPPSVTVCRNCNKPISRSNSYGWLHIGGWFLCDNSEPQPFAEPTDNDPLRHDGETS